MDRYRMSWGYVLLGALFLVNAVPSLVWACAVCWGGDDAFTRALNTSILFLMAMPFVIGGSIMGVLFMAQRRARGQRWPASSKEPLA